MLILLTEINLPLNLAFVKTLSKESARHVLTAAKTYYGVCAFLSVIAISTSSAAAVGFGLYLANSVKFNNGEDKEFFKKGLLISLAFSFLSFTYLTIKSLEYARFKQIFLPELEKIANQ